MPIYEYYCPDCDLRFEARRSMAEADHPLLCAHCQRTQAQRVVSSFAAHASGGGSVSSAPSSSGSACGSCSTKHCSACGVH